jgi:hypothetical protein
MSENKKEKEVQIIIVDGIPCINLDEPMLPRAVHKFFPFSEIQDEKKKYFVKVLEELKKRKPVANSIVPFDIYVIDIINFKPKKENEDDCESE